MLAIFNSSTCTISYCELSVKLICTFVFAYADCWFSYDAAHYTVASHKTDNPEMMYYVTVYMLVRMLISFIVN